MFASFAFRFLYLAYGDPRHHVLSGHWNVPDLVLVPFLRDGRTRDLLPLFVIVLDRVDGGDKLVAPLPLLGSLASCARV